MIGPPYSEMTYEQAVYYLARHGILKSSMADEWLSQYPEYHASQQTTNSYLTTGSDVVNGTDGDDTVNGTLSTLNAGDRLVGGAGIDTLVLITGANGGTFRIDQLATFTGFEVIRTN